MLGEKVSPTFAYYRTNSHTDSRPPLELRPRVLG